MTKTRKSETKCDSFLLQEGKPQKLQLLEASAYNKKVSNHPKLNAGKMCDHLDGVFYIINFFSFIIIS